MEALSDNVVPGPGHADLSAAVRQNPLEHLSDVLPAAQAEVAKAIVGHDRTVEMMLIAVLARCHVLVEGPPGTGKTLLAQAVARLLGARFHRIQFTDDTSPEDLIGRIRMRGAEKVFEPGALFTNILLVDEINRTRPHTQASLLEAMQERTVTVGGDVHRLESPFFVLATQNSHEQQGVYRLPESQLDRFLFKIHLDYGTAEDELAMLDLPRRGVTPDVIGDIMPLLGERGVLVVQDAVELVEVPEDVARLAVALVRRTRELPGVSLGAGSRAIVHVVTAAKARAALRGRGHATASDVVAVAREALPHRVHATGDARQLVEQVLDELS